MFEFGDMRRNWRGNRPSACCGWFDVLGGLGRFPVVHIEEEVLGFSGSYSEGRVEE